MSNKEKSQKGLSPLESNQDSIKLSPREATSKFLIVGIGASAGGIKALRDFFEAIRPDSGCAYVVILHLSPEFESKLAEILQTRASIPVMQVTERIKVEANHAYVIPPNKSLQMIDGMLAVSPITNYEERRAPIDIFFRTLGDNHDARSIAIVLSGTGSDGSMGVKRVKERGGIIMVQEPDEAEYKDMPLAALDTDLVDYVLPVASMPGHIIQYRNHLRDLQLPEDETRDQAREEREEVALHDVFIQLRLKTGHDFTSYKRATILRRIARRMGVREIEKLEDYTALLKRSPEESEALLKDLLISVTNFFRDREAFNFLEREIIPAILRDKKGGDQVRVWVTACATGEEAYTMAMLFTEQMSEMSDPPQLQIFASDIDNDAIATAREALYNNADVADVSPERLQRFFIREGDDLYRVRRELRETILFAHHNILRDPPFSRLSLATCRNLLIYLMRSAQNRVLQTLHFALEPGGYLMLGSSESTDGTGDLYLTIDREQCIFQSRAVKNRPVPPVPEVPAAYRTMIPITATPIMGLTKTAEKLSLTTLHYKVLEHYAPPSVLVNAEYDIVHLSDRVGDFLHIAGGEPSYNLLKAVRPELRLELRSALYEAAQGSSIVRTVPVPMHVGHDSAMVTVVVRPVMDPTDTARGFLLVVFEKGDKPGELDLVKSTGGPEDIVKHMEQDLSNTRLQLRSATEQYEIQTEELRASNEELQAINEELRSAAEELETGKEELQSVNEELTTVNQELKVKIDELSHANNDFQNLMAATDIGTVFLDRSFNVKLFTPAAREIFNLLPNDYGRPLSDITHHLIEADLMGDATAVMQRLVPVEREVHTTKGEAYLMRLSPYRTEEDRISGVVVTFINITRRVEAEEQLRRSELRFRTMTNAIPQLVWTNEAGGVANYFNQRWYEYSGLTYDESFGPGWQIIVHPEDAAQSIEKWQVAIKTGQVFDTEYRLRRHDGVYRWHIGRNVPLRDDNGAIIAWFGSATDIEDRKQAEAAMRESEERLRLIMESVKDYAIYTTDLDRIVVSWNTGAEAVFGYTEAEMLGACSDILFTPEDIINGAPQQESQTALLEGRAADERWHMRKDGSRFYASGVMTPLHDNGKVHGFVKIARDLTEKMLTEQRLRASEERYQTFIQQSAEGIWRFEMEEAIDTSLPVDEQVAQIYEHSHVAECNDAMARMYGYPNASGMEHARLTYLLPPEDSSAYIQQFIRSGYRVSEAETRRTDKDGKERYYINNLVGFVEDGMLKRAWGMQRDITERKALEKIKEDFIGIASHELRTPVTSIKVYAELLSDTLTGDGDTESASLVQKLDGQVDRLTALIKDLLDVTRISEGKIPLSKDVFSINELIEEIAEEMRHTSRHRIDLTLQPAPEIHADRERIRQVIVNIMSNAIKYSPEADRVLITSGTDADCVKVCVQDYGIGMSDETRKMVFERFYRGRDSEINTYPGLGLGLYIAGEIVQRHKGRIWVDSEQGKGSTFCFSLPIGRDSV